MASLSGKTYEWKNELKAAGFRWNAAAKTWDRAEALDSSKFADEQILRAIADGDLNRGPAQAVNRLPHTAREAMEFESGFKY